MPFIDSENVFPKRLGIMNGNTLVLEYYNLEIDKFKKHRIPFEPSLQSKGIIEQIYKNSKHAPFLKKIDPKHVMAVLDGQKIFPKNERENRQRNNYQNFEENVYQKQPTSDRQQFLAEKKQESITSIINPSSKVKSQKSINQIDDDYAEQFESFSISQSTQQNKSNLSTKPKIDIKPQKQQEIPKKQPIKQNKPIKQAKPIPSKVQIEVQEEYADDFEFIDQEVKPPSKKNKKQQIQEEQSHKPKEKKKSKSKQKNKEGKSKQKKQKQGKKDKQTKSKKKIQQQKAIQEQFQFL